MSIHCLCCRIWPRCLHTSAQYPGKYDLVLCDVMLPVMNGMQLLECMMKNDDQLTHIFVVMTIFNEEIDVVTSCLSKGTKDYPIIPIQVSTAKTLVRHVWLSRQQGHRMHSGNVARTYRSNSIWQDSQNYTLHRKRHAWKRSPGKAQNGWCYHRCNKSTNLSSQRKRQKASS